MFGGDCRSRQLCRVSPALTDSLPPPESWQVGGGRLLPAPQTPAAQPLEGGTGSQLGVDAVPSGSFPPAFAPLVKPKTAGEPPVQGSHFLSPSQAAHAVALSWDVLGSLLVPGPWPAGRNLPAWLWSAPLWRAGLCPGGPSPHCQQGSSTPVLSRVAGNAPRGLGKGTLRVAIRTSLRVCTTRGKTVSSSSCLGSKHLDFRQPQAPWPSATSHQSALDLSHQGAGRLRRQSSQGMFWT